MQIALYFIAVIFVQNNQIYDDGWLFSRLITPSLSHFSAAQHQALCQSLWHERGDGVSFPQGDNRFSWRNMIFSHPFLARCRWCVCQYSQISLTTPPGWGRGGWGWALIGNMNKWTWEWYKSGRFKNGTLMSSENWDSPAQMSPPI